MKCYGLWYGGSSYAPADQFNKKDIDEFDSLTQAKNVFESRYNYNPYYPCVDDDAEMWICFYDPFEVSDVYPDRIIKFGPRGGILIEHG